MNTMENFLNDLKNPIPMSKPKGNNKTPNNT